MLSKYMPQLVQELSIEGDLSGKTPGTYEFPVDEEINVILTEIPGGFEMSCQLPETKIGNEEEFFNEALLANLYGRGTSGCVLGLDGEGKRLTLSQTIDYNTDYKEFRDLLEDFLNSSEFWNQEIKASGIK